MSRGSLEPSSFAIFLATLVFTRDDQRSRFVSFRESDCFDGGARSVVSPVPLLSTDATCFILAKGPWENAGLRRSPGAQFVIPKRPPALPVTKIWWYTMMNSDTPKQNLTHILGELPNRIELTALALKSITPSCSPKHFSTTASPGLRRSTHTRDGVQQKAQYPLSPPIRSSSSKTVPKVQTYKITKLVLKKHEHS